MVITTYLGFKVSREKGIYHKGLYRDFMPLLPTKITLLTTSKEGCPHGNRGPDFCTVGRQSEPDNRRAMGTIDRGCKVSDSVQGLATWESFVKGAGTQISVLFVPDLLKI